jgi:hypothetical protein
MTRHIAQQTSNPVSHFPTFPLPHFPTFPLSSLLSSLLLFGLALLLAGGTGRADEGMWLYNHPPRELLRERYGFEPSAAWLEHLQQASVRFGGGSGSFVSADGLILSNHHIGAGSLQRLSTAGHNYMRDGFHARTRAEEKPVPGLEVSVLKSIADVTARVNGAVTAGLSDEAAFRARRAAIAAIEKESFDQTGLRSEVVTLYQGAEYHLYRYKRYPDVRLVFAPEEQIAFYGGDPDNFEYPRYDLDICLFRAYEQGQPAHPEHYLKWSQAGPAERELVFVSGHPGRTDRLLTVAELEYLRDGEYPRALQRLKRSEVLLASWSARSAENARRARNDLFGARNARKARDGMLAGLLDPQLMAGKRAAEEKLRGAAAALAQEPGRRAEVERAGLEGVDGAWDRIAQAQKGIAERAVEYEQLERSAGFSSALFGYGRQLARAAAERPKPDGQRLEEHQQAKRAGLEHGLLAETPVYADLEMVKLTDSLTLLVEALGYNHPVVTSVLGNKSPRQRAAEAVGGSKLAAAAVRRQLYEGGEAAVAATRDGMIELAQLVDGPARAVRAEVEARREAIRQAQAQIGRARYLLGGPSLYPDASGTLRLAFGTVTGYEEDGRQVPFETTFAGLYQRAAEQHYRPPFDLPARWLAKKKKLKLATPFNFVCTADIIGGNSGSPVVNRQGEFVGIIFDGNIQSLAANLSYTETQCRAVAVHSSGILEALEKLYGAQGLVKELRGIGGR